MNDRFVRWIIVLGFFLVMPNAVWVDEEKVLYEGDSIYHHIRVSEQGGYRYLSFNRYRGSQSAVNVRDPYELKFAYTRAAFVIPAFLERQPERICFIGLGGGSIPRVMAKHYPDARIDVVEIDPGVVDAAKKYFFFTPTPRMEVTVMDGRNFLRRTRNRYDLIFLDAYDDRAIPFHLTTREFLDIVKGKLTPEGVAVSNVWGPRTDQFYLSELKTYQQVFSHVYLIDAVSSNNYLFVAELKNAGMTLPRLMERTASLQSFFQFDFSLAHFAETFEDMTGKPVDADILQDDFAPVEMLRSRKGVSP